MKLSGPTDIFSKSFQIRNSITLIVIWILKNLFYMRWDEVFFLFFFSFRNWSFHLLNYVVALIVVFLYSFDFYSIGSDISVLFLITVIWVFFLFWPINYLAVLSLVFKCWELFFALLLFFNFILVSSLSVIRKYIVDFNSFKFCKVSFMAHNMVLLGNGHLKRMCILLFVVGWNAL